MTVKSGATIFGVSISVITYCVYRIKKIEIHAQKKKNENDAQNFEENLTTEPSWIKLGSTCKSSNDITEEKQFNKPDLRTTGNTLNLLQASTISYNTKYKNLIPKLVNIINQAKEEFGSPGISFAINHNGALVIKGGIGLADVENAVPCTSESILRIASISKSLTTLAIGKLLDDNLLDLNAPIQKYVSNFPEKDFDGVKVAITTKQLLSHTSGIRGYFDEIKKDTNKDLDDKATRKRLIQISKYGPEGFNSDENYYKENYATVEQGLTLFLSDPLVFRPGTDYEYSTLAYSLVSRIIEKISDKDFVSFMKKICSDIGMNHTVVDLNDPLIYNRARNYKRNKNGRLENVPYVDNSYKWSGGGFLSNVEDLMTFGNVMLKSVQSNQGYLKSSTVSTLWQPCAITTGKVSSKKFPKASYALGWCVLPNQDEKSTIFHTGGAVGASSVFLLNFEESVAVNVENDPTPRNAPRGTVIALIVNMQSVGLTETALRLLECFNEAEV